MQTEQKIRIPDLGIGNLASVHNMLRKVGAEVDVLRQPVALDEGSKLIIAGVGAFDAAMRALTETGWKDVLDEAVTRRKILVLGICLGMQVMCKSSEEGHLRGLGWIDGEVRRFKFPAGSTLKIPHMGWNTITVCKTDPLISTDAGVPRFYFVHSYHVVCNDSSDVLATAHHGYDFTAAFSRGNLFGVQFHPEKSHRFGMALLSGFSKLHA